MPEKNTPLTDSEVPTQLKEALDQPAIGSFPAFEKALRADGVTIPKAWTVANFLSAVCVGVSTEIRKGLKLPESEPQEVRLICDEYHYNGNTTTTKSTKIKRGGYNMMGYEVIFPDGIDFYGSIRMPGYLGKAFWGLPWFCSRKGVMGQIEGYGDSELINYKKGQFTPNGLKLLNFIEKTIRKTS